MPTKSLPPRPDLDHLKHLALDLTKARIAGDPSALQRIREFHPRFARASDAEIQGAEFALADALFTIAREHGFASWPRLRERIEKPTRADDTSLPAHERIEDPTFRRAVELLDAGDVEGLRAHLAAHPDLVHRRVRLEGGNYFREPTLIEFVAENPVRHDRLPANIVEVARVILDAGADRASASEAAMLVASGRVAREHGAQVPLLDLLCARGADPDASMLAALAHGEMDAVRALLRNGARMDLPAAAALGDLAAAMRELPSADPLARHRALALAAQLGHAEIVRLLLDAGEDPSRYNPVGAHSHSTPLHQAIWHGHLDAARVLVERGARLDLLDTLWKGTPLDWAIHGKREAEVRFLRLAGAKTAAELAR